MIVMAFDLSSSCIGCVVAETQGKRVLRIRSCPIIPKAFSAESLGYLKTKRKIDGKKTMTSWIRFNGEIVSEAEKKRRDAEVRAQKDVSVLAQISGTMGDLISTIKPELILVEKNEMFNGVLTSVLLGKVMGTLHGIAGMLRIPVREFRVNKVRQPLGVSKLVLNFTQNTSAEELMSIPDVTKRALRKEMERKYHIQFLTDDESDACVVFDYWLNNEAK